MSSCSYKHRDKGSIHTYTFLPISYLHISFSSQVSWVRGADIRLLTTGSITYTSDTRFVAVNPSKGEQWVLKIHYVRKSDAGSYLCQVSTTPPITLTVNLTVQGLRSYFTFFFHFSFSFIISIHFSVFLFFHGQS